MGQLLKWAARWFAIALIHGAALAWVAFNGGLFMSDPEARIFKLAITLTVAMLAAAAILDWRL